jgi:hypothetical protein
MVVFCENSYGDDDGFGLCYSVSASLLPYLFLFLFLLILVDVCFGFVMVMIEFNVVDWWLWVKVYYDCDGVYEVSTFFSMIQPPLL